MSEPAPRPPYETLYGVGLLDDIHNYYPAILYDPTRFHSVGALLHYFQIQTRERFDLFTFGQRAYLATQLAAEPETTQTTDVSGVHTPPIRPRVALNPPFPGRVYRTNRIFVEEETGMTESAAESLLATLIGALANNHIVAPPQFDDVTVAPTAEQISAGTSIIRLEQEDICSVCQDTITTEDNARRINHCEHSFHVGCIDTWFVRNVRCPVCRHDIRETTNESIE
jgi:hypothetical protein